MIDIDKIRRSAGIIGESDQIQEMLALIGQVANTDISVLITGESGSGKELVAKAVHKNSRRKFENMMTVNSDILLRHRKFQSVIKFYLVKIVKLKKE